MNDLISRQALISAFKEEFFHMYSDDFNYMIKWFEELPTAEPEIIKCKECLMHGVCRFEQGLGLDGYCSQAERRNDG